MKNQIFHDLKSAKISPPRIELKFEGKAAFTVTNTKSTISGLQDDL